MAREWRTVNGQAEVQCSSCLAFKPATRKHFYFQRKKGELVPHSWCKPCYSSNRGRDVGMMTCLVDPAVPPEVSQAQARFLMIPAPLVLPLVGAGA